MLKMLDTYYLLSATISLILIMMGGERRIEIAAIEFLKFFTTCVAEYFSISTITATLKWDEFFNIFEHCTEYRR